MCALTNPTDDEREARLAAEAELEAAEMAALEAEAEAQEK